MEFRQNAAPANPDARHIIFFGDNVARHKKLADPDKPIEIKKTKTGKVTKKTTRRKFKPEFVEQAKDLVAKGYTEKDIALELGVAFGTIQTWKHRNEDFRLACEAGMKARVAHIAAKGMQAAEGYEYTETVETFKPKTNEETGETELELVEKKVYTKHKPTDGRLIEFFLINYAPDMFRSINKIESLHDNSKNLIIADGTGQVTEQLTKLAGAFLDAQKTTKKVECEVIEQEENAS